MTTRDPLDEPAWRVAKILAGHPRCCGMAPSFAPWIVDYADVDYVVDETVVRPAVDGVCDWIDMNYAQIARALGSMETCAPLKQPVEGDLLAALRADVRSLTPNPSVDRAMGCAVTVVALAIPPRDAFLAVIITINLAGSRWSLAIPV